MVAEQTGFGSLYMGLNVGTEINGHDDGFWETK